MPRQLPWKVTGGGAKPAPRQRKTESPSLPGTASPAGSDRTGPARPFSRPNSGTSTPAVPKSRRSLTARPDRSPSTSPPPEPISEDFMIEGFDHDDRYRMVEDEFLAMANDFTKHLHAAEYQRLKALASTRNADMIRTISRPVTGAPMTDQVKKRRSALELAASQRKGIRNALGKRKGREGSDDSDDDDGEVPWAGTSLQGLMESPRKVAVPLPAGSSSLGQADSGRRPSGAASSAVSTFASRVGTGRSRTHGGTTTDDDDEDDLDAHPRYRRRRYGEYGPDPQAGRRRTPGPSSSDCDAGRRRRGGYPDPQAQRPKVTRPRARSTSSDRSGGRSPGKVASSGSNTLSLNQKVASIEAMSRRGAPTAPPTSTPAVSVEDSLIAMSARQTERTKDVHDDDDDFLARIRKQREQQRKRREGSSTGDGKKPKGRNSAVDTIPLF